MKEDLKGLAITGLQLTGKLHIGNYFGSVKPISELQNKNHTMLFVADLHAMTSDPIKNLNQDPIKNVSMYLACGIDEKLTSIFLQSRIHYLFELFWILNCFSKHGDLSRMTQFKSKSKSNNSFALMSYPVLMAADILLYGATVVPIGNDQIQHIEITKKIANNVNNICGKEILKIPYALKSSSEVRIMSLKNGNQKMSKSDSSDASRINLDDTNELIIKKIQSAKTDSENSLSVNIHNRPEVKNLIKIFSLASNISEDKIINQYNTLGFKKFKESLADAVISTIEPIRKRYIDILKYPEEIKSIMKTGNTKALEKAEKTILSLRKAIGI